MINENRKEYTVERMCRVLGISPSNYYKKRRANSSERKFQDGILKRKILNIYEENEKVYGARRIVKELHQQENFIGKRRVKRLMKELKIQGIQPARFRLTTTVTNQNLPVSPNLLDRNFFAYAPNKVWVSDITYIKIKNGFYYLCVIVDLYSRKVVGWSLKNHMKKELVIDALRSAIRKRKPASGLIFHSDRGSQYQSNLFRKILFWNGFESSMSRKGDCWDNAVAESFFKTIKTELIYRNKFENYEELRKDVFKYIEVFYNRKRLHSFIGYQSPSKFEEKFVA